MAAPPGDHGDTRRENREDFTKIDFLLTAHFFPGPTWTSTLTTIIILY